MAKDTLASRTMGHKVTTSDGGQLGGMKFLSPLYSSGIGMAEVAKPRGFDGDVPDPLHYTRGGESLKGSYGKGKK